MRDNFEKIKIYIREINAKMLCNDDINKYVLDTSRRYKNRIRFRMPNRKLINYISKSGGVLVGSRALKCWSVNDNYIFDRNCKDWDFVVTPDMVFDICNKFGIKYNLLDKVISVKKCRYWRHPDYSESYAVGPVDVQIIINDTLPKYTTSNGLRVADLNYCFNQKVKFVDSLIGNNDKEAVKHLDDLTSIIMKLKHLK